MLYVVHCVDTEGPLWEPLGETFLRIESIYGIKLDPTEENLEKLRQGRIDLGSAELNEAAKITFSSQQLGFYGNWQSLDAMLERIDQDGVRRAVTDSAGKGWHVNWHILAHHGFDPDKNPRRRDLGIHKVFDHYAGRYAASSSDSLHWHFHPLPFDRQANHCATAYLTNPSIFEIISRRVLERLWFPCVNRPGFNVERPDSHWFLEQWLPYDLANNNVQDDTFQPDFAQGRYGDWRWAPKDWTIYHPSHDDYQVPGNCRRAIGRCLTLGGRYSPLTKAEVERAFLRAQTAPTLMSFTNHDFRDLEDGIRSVQEILAEVAGRYPSVPWYYADSAQAMRACLGHGDAPHAKVSLEFAPAVGKLDKLVIGLDRAPFGPQPWFCLELADGSVHYDNLDREPQANHWSYCFDEQSAPLNTVRKIGIATNTPNGRTTVVTYEPHTGKREEAYHN